MKFLPYERLKIKTRLDRNAVLLRLDDAVEPKRSFRLFVGGDKPYQGKVEGSRFEISRILVYRNSFLPMIKGEVETEIGGCSIYITMQPHVLVIAFMIVWLGGVGSFFFVLLYSLISPLTQPHTTNPTLLLISGGMFVFGYAMFFGGFKFESINSKNFFRELFEAEEVEELGIANHIGTGG